MSEEKKDVSNSDSDCDSNETCHTEGCDRSSQRVDLDKPEYSFCEQCERAIKEALVNLRENLYCYDDWFKEMNLPPFSKSHPNPEQALKQAKEEKEKTEKAKTEKAKEKARKIKLRNENSIYVDEEKYVKCFSKYGSGSPQKFCNSSSQNHGKDKDGNKGGPYHSWKSFWMCDEKGNPLKDSKEFLACEHCRKIGRATVNKCKMEKKVKKDSKEGGAGDNQ